MKYLITIPMTLLFVICIFATQPKIADSSSSIQPTTPAAPGPRIGHVLVYNEQLHRVVLLSGYPASRQPELEETWAWNGKQWELITNSGPLARGMSGAVYDTNRKKVVLYAGVGNKSREDFKNDTWEWDGKNWLQMNDTAIGTRDHHSMAYDAGRGRTVMFGGVGTTRHLQNDTWEWDGAKWNQVATQGPEPRGHFAMVYDSRRKQIVLFGGAGEGQGQRFGDTWTWDGKLWRKVSETGPEPMSHHRMAFDRRAGVVVLFTSEGDTWTWDGKQWNAMKTPGPSKRYMAAMAYDAARGKTVLYGGASYAKETGTTIHDDTWEWDGKQWAQIK